VYNFIMHRATGHRFFHRAGIQTRSIVQWIDQINHLSMLAIQRHNQAESADDERPFEKPNHTIANIKPNFVKKVTMKIYIFFIVTGVKTLAVHVAPDRD